MNREEMIKRMQNVDTFGKSKLHMRSEALQQRQQIKRIPMLKKDLKKKAKLLVIADLAIPFNPRTGVADDEFNEDNKFRPALSATTTALMLKMMVNESEESKNAFMRRAGVEEWDTTDVEHLTDADCAIFGKYRVPRVFTVPVVHVNIPVMTRNEFGKDYAISVARDPMTGEVIGDVPLVLQINKLFRDKIYEQIKEFDDKCAKGEYQLTEKQQKEKKSDIYKQNPVSDVQPSNWLTIIELPMTDKYQLSSELNIAEFDEKAANAHLVITRYTAKLRTAIEKYKDGSWGKYDKNFDFFELDMACPTEGDSQSQQGKMLIGKDTEFEKPTNCLDECMNEEELGKFVGACRDYIDSAEEIEADVRRSMFTPPYSEEVENQLATSVSTVLDITKDKYMTQKVIEENKDVISLCFGNQGIELIDLVDAGCSDAAEGSLDTADAAASAKKYSLDSADFNDDATMDDIELDVETLE